MTIPWDFDNVPPPRSAPEPEALVAAFLDQGEWPGYYADSFLVTDPNLPDNPIVHVDKGFELMTGYSRDEALGRNCRFLQRGDHDQPGLKRLRAALRSKTEATVRLRNYHKDGTLFWNELHVRPLIVAGALTYFFATQRDVTSIVKLENQLNEVQEEISELAHLHAELERTQAALHAQNEELKEVNGFKSEFLAQIAHELKTPLTVVLGYAELLFDLCSEEAVAEGSEYLNIIRESGQHLRKMIDDLLDLSKAEAKCLELSVEPFNLNERLGRVLKSLQTMLQQKQLTLEVTVPDEPLIVSADAQRVHQVVLNLLTNAVKFTPERGVIRLSVYASEAGICTEVSDTGPGISAADQARLFKPFVQLPSLTGTLNTGTGLGLALCKQLVELHGGKMWLHSRLAGGSTFGFSLPRQLEISGHDLVSGSSRDALA